MGVSCGGAQAEQEEPLGQITPQARLSAIGLGFGQERRRCWIQVGGFPEGLDLGRVARRAHARKERRGPGIEGGIGGGASQGPLAVRLEAAMPQAGQVLEDTGEAVRLGEDLGGLGEDLGGLGGQALGVQLGPGIAGGWRRPGQVPQQVLHEAPGELGIRSEAPAVGFELHPHRLHIPRQQCAGGWSQGLHQDPPRRPTSQVLLPKSRGKSGGKSMGLLPRELPWTRPPSTQRSARRDRSRSMTGWPW